MLADMFTELIIISNLRFTNFSYFTFVDREQLLHMYTVGVISVM